MAASSLIGSLAVSLSLETAAFTQGAKRAQTQATGLQKSMAGIGSGMKALGAGLIAGLGAGAIKDAIGRALDYASSLGEVAQQLGVTTSELQRYRFIATQVGIEQAEMDKGLAFLSRTLGDLSNGAKAPANALKELGFNSAEIGRISKMSAGEAIPLLADAFAKLKSPTEQAALAADLFGAKLGGKFLTMLAGGAKGINQLSEEYRKMGVELTPEQIAKADAAADSMAKLKGALEARVASVVAENADGVAKFAVVMNHLEVAAVKASSKIGEWGVAVVQAGASTRVWTDNAIKNVGGFINSIINAGTRSRQAVDAMVAGIRAAVVDRLNAIWEGAKQKVQAVADKFKWLWDVVTRRSYVPDMVDDIAKQMERLNAVMVAPAAGATSKVAQSFRDLASEVGPLLDRLFPDAAAMRQFANEVKLLDRAAKAGAITADTAAEAKSRLNLEGMEESKPTLESAGEPLIDLSKLSGGIDDFTKTLNDKLLVPSQETTAKMVEAFANMARDVAGSLQGLAGQIKSGDWLGAIASVLDVVGQIAGIIRGTATPATPTYNRFGGARAAGGPVVSGKSYIVGEKGPEWFTPNRAGFITPNNDNGGGLRLIVEPSDMFTVRLAQVEDRASIRGAVGGAHMAQQQAVARRRRALS